MENGGYVILNFKEDMDANLLYEKLAYFEELNKPIKIVYDNGLSIFSNFASFLIEDTPSSKNYKLSFIDYRGCTVINVTHNKKTDVNSFVLESFSPIFITIGTTTACDLNGIENLPQASYLLENFVNGRTIVLNFRRGASYNSNTVIEANTRIYITNFLRVSNTLTFNFTVGNATNIYYVKAVVNGDDSTITFTTLEK